jgi:pimeloyl-ACP methyl ester carboxylesterase
MQPLFEYEAEFAGHSTRVLELEGEGPPVVLVHGWSDSADTWRHTLAALGRADRAAIAIDMPGYGKAEPLDDSPILPQLDSFIDSVAEAAGPGAIFVGNSLGGCVSLRLAERRHDLGGVVAVAPAGLEMPRWLSIIERDPILRRVMSLPVPLPPAALRAGVGRVYSTLAFADPDRIEPRVVRNFTRHFQTRERIVGLLENGKRLLPELRDPFELDRIASRVLLVWGSEDRMVYPAGADKLLATVADSRLELLEGCGHCPQLEEPERFSSLLFDFIGLRVGLRAA